MERYGAAKRDATTSLGRKVFIDHDSKEVSRAHYSVLQSTQLMQPYIDEHLAIIMAERNGRSDDWVMKQHKQ